MYLYSWKCNVYSHWQPETQLMYLKDIYLHHKFLYSGGLNMVEVKVLQPEYKKLFSISLSHKHAILLTTSHHCQKIWFTLPKSITTTHLYNYRLFTYLKGDSTLPERKKILIMELKRNANHKLASQHITTT